MAFCRELGEVAFLPEETERDDQLMSFRFVGRERVWGPGAGARKDLTMGGKARHLTDRLSPRGINLPKGPRRGGQKFVDENGTAGTDEL